MPELPEEKDEKSEFSVTLAEKKDADVSFNFSFPLSYPFDKLDLEIMFWIRI